eukprot:scaffold7335_cov289-Pinguiococcus_pyrenoidosus.AAC.3
MSVCRHEATERCVADLRRQDGELTPRWRHSSRAPRWRPATRVHQLCWILNAKEQDWRRRRWRAVTSSRRNGRGSGARSEEQDEDGAVLGGDPSAVVTMTGDGCRSGGPR